MDNGTGIITEESALRAAAITDPSARLALADWLDEHDCPIDAATQRVLAEPADDRHRLNFADAHERVGSIQRARFVRLQVEHAAIDPNTLTSPNHVKNRDPHCPCRWCQIDRETLEINLAVDGNWVPKGWHCKFAHYRTLYERPTAYFARGFACRASCTPAEWFTNSDDLTAAHPIQAVWFTAPPVAHVELRDTLIYGIRGFDKTYPLPEVFEQLKREGRLAIPASVVLRALREGEAQIGVLSLAYPGVTFAWDVIGGEVEHVVCGETTVPASGWLVEVQSREVRLDSLDYSYSPAALYHPQGYVEQILLSLTYQPTAFALPPRMGDTFGPVNGRGHIGDGAGYRVHRAIVRNVTMRTNGLLTVEAVSAGAVNRLPEPVF